jgi:hypothetical protein
VGASHVRREANEVAHMLGKLLLFVGDKVIHIEKVPQCVIDILMAGRYDNYEICTWFKK